MVLPIVLTVARQKGAKQGGGTGFDRENSNYSESPRKRCQATFYMTEKLTQGGMPQRYLPQKNTKSPWFSLSHGNVFNFRGIVGIIRRLNIRK